MGFAWVGGAVALSGAFLFGRLEAYWRPARVAVVIGITLVVLGWGYAFWWAFAATFS
jgi:hypothetical protein